MRKIYDSKTENGLKPIMNFLWIPKIQRIVALNDLNIQNIQIIVISIKKTNLKSIKSMLGISTSWLTAGPQKQAHENSLWSDPLRKYMIYRNIFSYFDKSIIWDCKQ